MYLRLLLLKTQILDECSISAVLPTLVPFSEIAPNREDSVENLLADIVAHLHKDDVDESAPFLTQFGVHLNTYNSTAMSHGNYTYWQPEIRQPHHGAGLIVGNYCSIGGYVKVYLGGNHRTDWVSTYPFGHINTHVFNTFDGQGHPRTNGSVTIGNDVWIGEYATIMSGVTIGDGAVIACNSHVVKDVEPYSMVGGNPAKLIKYRFTKEQIESLMRIKWWLWDDEKVNKFAPLLCQPDIDKFIAAADSFVSQ